MDIEKARFNMVEQQIRPWEVLDEAVLDAVRAVKREDYVPSAYRNMAFMDIEIPLGQGEAMLSPKVEARMLQAAALSAQDTVLEIGTGSAYMTALLARLARHVYSVDIVPEFNAAATAKLAAHDVRNVTLEVGDAVRGWARYAPYDVIMITGSLPQLPQELLQQLRPGGRLLAFVGTAPAMTARRVHLLEPGVSDHEDLFETQVAALKNAPKVAGFVF